MKESLESVLQREQSVVRELTEVKEEKRRAEELWEQEKIRIKTTFKE